MPYTKARISIPNVTGDIVITATAVSSAKENLFLKDSTDTYTPKYRINSAGQIVTSAASMNACVTNKININSLSYSITTDAENQSDRNDGYACVVVFYSSDDTLISRLNYNSSGWTWSNNYLSATLTAIPSNAAYMRFVLNYANLDNIKIYAE